MTQSNPFQQSNPSIVGNQLLRVPQRESFEELVKFAQNQKIDEREIGVILPVGCGKSGCITLAPFAFKSQRTLVVAPGLNIAHQLFNDFDPAQSQMFYQKCKVLPGPPYPEPVEIRGQTTNQADLEEAHIVLTNIQQLQGDENRWLQNLANDFFDLIIFDEGHHSVAESWTILKNKFSKARIINFSATPQRADGQMMAGHILYSFSIFRAIREGYVKQLKAVVLNPATLRYVHHKDGTDVDIDLDEVRRLGEENPNFRRSIVTSTETLNTIVDASIRELQKKREETGEKRLKIIASALNYNHCHQIVRSYRERGQSADFVHSRENRETNQRILEKLESHELDVIVQVRKLGEGFDHPFLSVAAIFSIFSNLSPFVQFVGRIMRVIKQDDPESIINQGTVIFHAGTNIARRWQDFQEYSESDKDFFEQFLPIEELDFSTGDELEIIPRQRNVNEASFSIKSQDDIMLQTIPLLRENPKALAALKTLRDEGYSADEIKEEFERLDSVPVTKARQRQAKRAELDERVKTEVGRILSEHNINPEGRNLDRQHLDRSNFVVIKSAIDRAINQSVDRAGGSRNEFNINELNHIEENFDRLTAQATEEIFNGSNKVSDNASKN
ncbi:DEAD/DEAH box helicase [Thioalkalivibrio sp. HK1]|uniref:DEAD/DEAH box helicase n=1 Tax=Thioalkalivibrio sp. HK1 TaxID=1469245 RepID=UPI0005705FFE|nr:DEAD/DEAH box helicase family protein [Thioalkalivibrio sp. HK1]